MSQHDYVLDNDSGAAFRGDANSVLGAIVTQNAGAAEPATMYPYEMWADTTGVLLKRRNAANTGWIVRDTLAETFVVARSSNTIIAAADFARTFSCTSSFTQTLTAAATLGDGFWCKFINSGTGVITLDPNGAETIDGVATIRLMPGEACVVFCNATGFVTIGRLASTYLAAFTKAINGFTYGNGDGAGAGDQTNDITIAAGGAMDSTAAYWITGSAKTKQLDASWAVGTAAGGLDTGSIGNSDYYIWAIARSDTGVSDYLFSLSSTAPTMPSSYDYKRLIGWFKRVGATIVPFHTYETEGGGIELTWDSPTLDVNLANTLTTARRTDAVKVPLNFSTIACINVDVMDNPSVAYVWICCPDQSDLAPSISAAPLSNINAPSAAVHGASQLLIRTSAAGLIASRANVATVDFYGVSTMGFTWARRN